jgi:hypothetical protein
MHVATKFQLPHIDSLFFIPFLGELGALSGLGPLW